MTLTGNNVSTRGFGLAESFLAGRRWRMVERLLPDYPPDASLLDLGCGTPPGFLLRCTCAGRTGLDSCVQEADIRAARDQGLTILSHDLQADTPLPFADARFDLITMAAVLEHLSAERAPGLLRDVHRVLKPGGVFVLTVPAPWTAPVLRVLSRLRLVSSVEIEDHKAAHGCGDLAALLRGAGFAAERVQTGRFLCLANIWARAVKL